MLLLIKDNNSILEQDPIKPIAFVEKKIEFPGRDTKLHGRTAAKPQNKII